MSLIAQINGTAAFVASVNGSTPFNITAATSSEFVASMAAIGPAGSSGVATATFPVIYTSETQNISIEPNYFALVSALDDYLLVADAEITYQTIAGMSAYLTAATAASTYYPLTNPAGYITSAALNGYATESWVLGKNYLISSDLAPYLLSTTAASTYYPLTNPSNFITAAALTGYATESWVTSQGYITSAALTPYLTSADAATTYYLQTNPSNFITSAALSGYATETWVQSQGYLTAPYNPFNQSLNTTDSVQFTNVQHIVSGDSNSIYVNNNQLTVLEFGGTGSPVRAVLDKYGLNLNGAGAGAGITFSDNTFQTTAATNFDPTGYATESWVTSQGYITSSALSPYLTSVTAASTYQTIAGMSAYALLAGANQFTAANTFTISSGSGVPVTITNLGTGNSLVVNDQTTPDSTPFIITSAGAVMIGTTSASAKLSIGELGLYSTSSNSSYPAIRAVSTGTAVGAVIQNDTTSTDSLVIRNGTSDNKVIVNKNGYVGIGVTPSAYPLDVNGTASVTSVRFGDGTIQTTAASAGYNPSVDIQNALSGAASPSASNVFATIADLGSPFDQSLNTTDSPSFVDVNADSFSPKSLNGNLNFVVYNDIGAGTTYTSYFDPYSGKLNVPYGIDVFDSFSGAQVNILPTSVVLQKYDGITNKVLTLSAETGITFPDATTQITAFPPTGGTTSQYIDGTGALQTFPSGGAASTLETTVYNNSGSTIPRHSVVYINGRHGNDPTIALAQANDETTSRSTFGFTKGDIPDQSLGTVTQVGLLEDVVYTLSMTEGALLFLDPYVAGGWTDTQPFSPNHYVCVGTAIRVHPTQGTIQVRIQNSNEFNELSDVQVTSAVTGDYLVKNGGGYWVPQALPSASDTVAGIVELATTAEAIAGTDTSRAVTPQGVAVEVVRRMARRYYQTNLTTLSSQSTGTGASYVQVNQYTNIVPPSAGIAGFTRGYCIYTHPESVTTIDWNKKNGFGCWTRFNNNTTIYNGISIRCGIGYTSSPTAGVVLGDLAVRGFGFNWTCGGNVFLQVHDGTTLRNIDTGYTPATSGQLAAAYLEAFSDGAGNVTALVRVTAGTTGAIPVDYVVTSANGPTGAYTTNPNFGYLFQVSSSTTHTTVYNAGGLHPTFFYD